MATTTLQPTGVTGRPYVFVSKAAVVIVVGPFYADAIQVSVAMPEAMEVASPAAEAMQVSVPMPEAIQVT